MIQRTVPDPYRAAVVAGGIRAHVCGEVRSDVGAARRAGGYR